MSKIGQGAQKLWNKEWPKTWFFVVLTVFKQFIVNISVNMRDREKFVINFFVENIFLRFKKKSSKSVQGFRSYFKNSGQNGVPQHFFANIS